MGVPGTFIETFSPHPIHTVYSLTLNPIRPMTLADYAAVINLMKQTPSFEVGQGRCLSPCRPGEDFEMSAEELNYQKSRPNNLSF